jgi:hypothetical protein
MSKPDGDDEVLNGPAIFTQMKRSPSDHALGLGFVASCNTAGEAGVHDADGGRHPRTTGLAERE